MSFSQFTKMVAQFLGKFYLPHCLGNSIWFEIDLAMIEGDEGFANHRELTLTKRLLLSDTEGVTNLPHYKEFSSRELKGSGWGEVLVSYSDESSGSCCTSRRSGP